ncbi:hypothetical protein [Dictyobacter aurantiacus]|uniref:Uncharacterized protein n=1 Tax=Dictyobacter aurantiacus TaxID=1936993 RepID=A0A401ZFH2_9CHLR|nr:hypothetical protein [Dictyobacter aurantiacus]GCE05599.1 hypothetical protein KDAU_29280 [Dictyobacter aurantiacus]
MSDEELLAFAQFISFVQDVRNYYSWLTNDDDLVIEVASILKRPADQVDFMVRAALNALRRMDESR